ncbi:unnamed protein product [Xylocopa violacea]|uniref:Titin-like n=1 Tax=Xylocopa violacea TaxID=135666 RepID=A0ABP1NRS4_XYLVO
MEDEDTLEEFEADSPEDLTELSLKSPSDISKSQSLPLTAPENGATSKIEQGSTPDEEPREPLEEKLSKSEEEVGKAQDLGLNGKKTSLDQLSKEKAPKTSKMHRQCHRRFRDMIGKRELKNEELEKQQGEMKQRLNILECSMPAVMVWNIWRMSQGNCVPNLRRVMEKQFQGPASGEVCCPRTPSRHFDCRVREVEAERKLAQKKIDEARRLWAEKMAVLEEKSAKLEEARRTQEETKRRIEQLTAEAKRLREAAAAAKAAEDDGSCETGDCGAIECKKKWLEKVPSSASIKSTDLECLQKLQELAENEVHMKRQIADLECREDAYMRTLQQADELWCKLEGDAASSMSVLREQLHSKTAANQQMADRICELEDVIEQLRSRLGICRGELEKYLSVTTIEALIGRDDDFFGVADKEVRAVAEMREEMIGEEDDMVDVEDIGILSKEVMEDRDVLAIAEATDADVDARPDMVDADLEMMLDVSEVGVEVRPDVADLEVDVHPADVAAVDDAQMAIHPDDFAYEDERLQEASAYLARLGSLSELDKYGDDYVCDPEFECNDVVLTESGLTEEEITALKEGRVTAQMLLEKTAAALDIDVAELSKTTVPSVKVARDVSEKIPDETVQPDLEISALPAEEARIDAEVDEARELDDESVLTEEFSSAEDVRPDEELRTEDFEPVEDVKVVDEGPVVTDKPETVSETVSETIPPYLEDIVDKDMILIPRNEIQSWQDDVDTVRAVIAECPDCIVVKKDADQLAASMAAHTGTKVKEIVDRPRPREEITPEVGEEKLPLEEDVSVEAKPEVAEVEIAAEMEEKEVEAEVVAKPLAPEEREVEAEPPKTPLLPPSIEKDDDIAEPEAVSKPEETLLDVVAEPAKEPTEVPAIAEEVEEAEVPVKEKEEEISPDVEKETPPAKDEEKTKAAPAVEREKIIEEEEEIVVPAEAEAPRAVEKKITKTEEKVKEVPVPAEKEEAVKEVTKPVAEEETVHKVPVPAAKEEAVKEVAKPVAEEEPVPAPKEAVVEEAPVAKEKPVKEVPVSKEEAVKEAPVAVPKEAVEKEVPVPVEKEAVAEEAPIPVPEEKEIKEIPVSVPIEEVVEEVPVPVSIEEEKEVLAEEVPVPVAIEKEEEVVTEVLVPVSIEEEEEVVKEVPIPVPIEEEEVVKEVPVSVPIEEEEEVIKEVPVSVPMEEEEIKEVPVLVPIEEEPEVAEEVAIEILPEEEEKVEEELIEIKEKEEEEIVVPVDIKEKIAEEEKIDVDVEILPEEEIEVELKEVEEELIEMPPVPVAEEPKVPVLEEEEIPCTCMPPIPPPKPVKKMKIVQTEITRIETIQVITQTVTDVETQTTPIVKQPKLVTVTKAVDPDSETMQRLLYGQPQREQQASTIFSQSSQVLKTSTLQMTTMDIQPAQHPLSSILQSLRTEGIQMKPSAEQELRSIHYGKKPEEHGVCNCCQCGKAMPASIPPSKTKMDDQPISMFKILSGSPIPKKLASPSASPSIQQETCLCPECKIKKLQETLKAHDPLKKAPKKDTRDQEVHASPPKPGKRQPSQKLKKRSDQGCMARIAKAKADRTPKRDEDQDSLRCICSGLIETGKPGVTKKVHCACGDPD